MTPDDIRALVDVRFDGVVDLRRDLHRHPELADGEARTTAVLRERMLSRGWTELLCPTPTGAVFALEGARPGRGVLLRADIDALPITEESGLAFASEVDGVMHACGHDGHAAILDGVAGALADRAEDLAGRYVCVFQPAEELGYGARRMVEGGLLEVARCDAALGLHLSSSLPAPVVGHRAGVAFSGAQPWRVHLRGAGGHTAIGGGHGSVVVAAAALVERLPAVVRSLEFEDVPCVCAAARLAAGRALNVVPRFAEVEGTLRTYTAAQQATALGRLRALCDAVAAECGVAAELRLDGPVPPVVNDAGVSAAVAAAAAAVLGEANVAEMPPMPPSDDVAEILARMPGTYLVVGARPGRGVPPQAHSPEFAIDEEGLRAGAIAMLAGALALAEG